MTPEERAEYVQKYREGYDRVVEALEGIAEEDLDFKPGADEWSPRMVVHHLADSEMTSAIRLRLLLASDEPTIHGYDEGRFATDLYYDRPIEASLAALKASRDSTAELLDRLTPEQWQRKGTHTESGPYDVETWLRIYAAHGYDHANQITQARKAAKGV